VSVFIDSQNGLPGVVQIQALALLNIITYTLPLFPDLPGTIITPNPWLKKQDLKERDWKNEEKHGCLYFYVKELVDYLVAVGLLFTSFLI
jgi:hypothetical protein